MNSPRRAPASGIARAAQSSLPAALLAAQLVLASHAAWPATLTEHMELGCTQPAALTLRCAYRLRDGGAVTAAMAERDGVVADGTVQPSPPADTAWLILIDTSDPARQPVVERAAAHVATLLALAPSNVRFGLARFDTDLFVLAPLGTERPALARAAAGLRAEGRTTELYRNVRDAVRLLGRDTAPRRVLMILSDGLAEDYAYRHDDVVAEARTHGVTIAAIGYPRSVSQSVALQTLRRLADETGGLYVQANHVDYTIPDGFLPRLAAVLTSGGEVNFDLTAFAPAASAAPLDLSLTLETGSQSLLVLVPVSLPVAQTVAAPPADGVTGVPAVRIPSPPAAAPAPRTFGVWLALFGVLLVTILAAIGLVLRKLRRVAAQPTEHHARPLAYLVAQEAPGARHAIDKTPWRIGRSRNADLTLNDHSVSRLHAEVRRDASGVLTLNDLESLNGVFVNDNRIESIELREGDTVDIGDVRLYFTLHDEAYASEEPTVLVRTRTPL